MNTIEQLQKELEEWTLWLAHEQIYYDNCTDDYTKQLLEVRLESGKDIVNKVQQELTAVTNAHNAALEDLADND